MSKIIFISDIFSYLCNSMISIISFFLCLYFYIIYDNKKYKLYFKSIILILWLSSLVLYYITK